ncbi:sensor histidine kinase [Deinococcus ruber]|uniref:histidine kinase n=1 Tax=Deinococcus ruber TaxID=1848197 RepID=A0A918FFS1_9DEIO|nr:HAMP domain-containing sensor histidine kinase [Deinococcus ruber]GGR35212.1 putative two component sensor kinase MprB [Deinococcus ruber]
MRQIRSLSLRLKLTLGYALIFSLSVLLGAAGVYLSASSTLQHSLDTTLSETASVAQASIEHQQGRYVFASGLKPSGDVYVDLLDQRGTRLAFAGTGVDDLPLPPTQGLRTAKARRYLTQQVQGGLFLRVSRSSDILSEVTEMLGRILAIGSLGMILLACAAGYFLADRALRPMDAVARLASRITESGNYTQRVPAVVGTDEMAVLTNTVNRLLDHMAGTIEREQSFARIAAHELRTPLTAIKGRLDLALERPRDNATYQKTLEVMRSRVYALVSLSEGLLELASTDAPLKLQRVELGSVVLDVVERLEEAFKARGKHLELDVGENWVSAELPGLQHLVQNLVENALKHGGGQVVVQVAPGLLAVHDGGMGPDPGEWERLLRPFERGSTAHTVPGNGLGLALVQSLARRWHAVITPSWSEKGFTVELHWPP